ncbi:hypothetical protein MMC18_002104 [Xylographa bjoerkii]|nr:hypothetical protein [Xylographa bjoerkii]
MATDAVKSGSRHRPIKRRKLMNDTVVTLIVGKKKRVFKIHKNLLCSASAYFKAALDGKFKEADTLEIELVEDSPKVIERFQLWLYTQSILESTESCNRLSDELLMEIYSFARVRLITKLQNDAIDIIIRKHVKNGTCVRSESLFPEPMEGSAIRKLGVHMMARLGSLECWDLQELCPPSSHGFLIEVILELYKEKDRTDQEKEYDFWKIRCDYHVHTKDEPRCSEDTPNPVLEHDSSNISCSSGSGSGSGTDNNEASTPKDRRALIREILLKSRASSNNKA